MPDSSSKPRGGTGGIDARSEELTKNLVTTRHQLENHFKSIKRREADFKKQKLFLYERELKAQQRMTRSPALDRQGSSPRSKIESPRREDSHKSVSRNPAAQAGLSRCWSNPDGFLGVQFPDNWGGHGRMPKPPGSPACFPLSVHRASASVPATYHPPPHPGAQSMRPTATRSMAAFASSVSGASEASASMRPAVLVQGTSCSPATSSRMLLTAERTANVCNSIGSRDGEEDFNAVDATLLNNGKCTEQSPMIKRLGQYMALLGPRYKLSKEMIWEMARRGEMSAAQRRLHKQGGIEAVMKRDAALLSKSRSAPTVVGETLASDSDGKARAAWLAARASERERGSRNSTGSSTKALTVIS